MASQTCKGLHQLRALPQLRLVICFSWLFRLPVFWFTSLFATQSVRLPLVTYLSLCSTCVTYRTPCHSIGHQVLPIQTLPREAEDFPRGGNHSKHVSLLTYLARLQPSINHPRLILSMSKPRDVFFCGEKVSEKAAILINSRE